MEVEDELIVQNKKVLISLIVGLLMFAAFSVPFAFATIEDDQVKGNNCDEVRVLGAKGLAKDRSSPEGKFVPAGFLLDLLATEIKPKVINFDIVGGIAKVDGLEYTIVEGKGAVIRYRRGFILEASGVDTAGEEVTLKLAGRYFWMWGRVYVARLVGVLKTVDTTYTLILKAAIRI